MDKSFSTLQLTTPHENILQVTLNRPQVRNAINSVMMTELSDLWMMLKAQNHKLRCVILTGSPPAFCAGADLKERKDLSIENWRRQRIALEEAMLAMIACPIPIIAAVNGAAYGGGLELVLSSDFAYAAKTATFAQTEVKIGIMPGAMGTQQLPRACGMRQAKELALTGASFNAEQACAWGIVNKICDNVMQETLTAARLIVENAPLAVRETKNCIDQALLMDLPTGFNYEISAYNRLLNSKDREEGIRAFNEKRKAVFHGE